MPEELPRIDTLSCFRRFMTRGTVPKKNCCHQVIEELRMELGEFHPQPEEPDGQANSKVACEYTARMSPSPSIC